MSADVEIPPQQLQDEAAASPSASSRLRAALVRFRSRLSDFQGRIPGLRRLSERQLAVLTALGLPFLFVSLLVVRGIFFVYFDRSDLPDIAPLVDYRPISIGEIEDARGEPIVQLARRFKQDVAYRDLPPVMRDAILAAEDNRFFRHGGIDHGALPRVVWKTFSRELSSGGSRKGLSFPAGGSTITQQLVRVYFLPSLTRKENREELLHDSLTTRAFARLIGVTATNKLLRKAEEIRLSLWLESEMRRRFGSKRAAKEQILARYASLVYLGNGRHGYAAASEHYFGKPLSDYTVEDAGKAALLAGITKGPEIYAPEPGNLGPAVHRRNAILDAMVSQGYLDEAVAARARKEEPTLAKHESVKVEAPAVVGAVFEELKALAAEQKAGEERLIEGYVKVRSTVDLRIQQVTHDALERGLAAYEARHPSAKGQIQGAAVVLRNRDGAILAEVGGRERFKRRETTYTDFNRATQASRQPGSAMKPIVYLTAFRRGLLTLDSPVPDQPISVPMGRRGPAKWIANYDRQFKGMISARQALAESRNTVAIWLAQQVGMPAILETAKELGIVSELDPWVSTALGASEVKLLELANVYRAIASGISATPHLIDTVATTGGSPIPVRRRDDRTLEVLGSGLGMLQEGLRGVVRLPGGTAHALAGGDFTIPVMGKTGTTNDYRDALFVGSTYGSSGITVAVRIGFDDNRPLGEKETGGRAALPVFKDVVQKVYAQDLVGPIPPFPLAIEQGIDTFIAESARRLEEAELLRLAEEAEGVALETLPVDGTSAVPPSPPSPSLGSDPSSSPRPTPILGRVQPTQFDGASSVQPPPRPTASLGTSVPIAPATPAPSAAPPTVPLPRAEGGSQIAPDTRAVVPRRVRPTAAPVDETDEDSTPARPAESDTPDEAPTRPLPSPVPTESPS